MRRRAAACFLFSGLLVSTMVRAQEEPPPPPPEEAPLPLPEGITDPSIPTTEAQPDCVDDGAGGCVEEEVVEQEIDTEAYTDFNQTLAPHGTWSETQDYGQVWFPSTTAVGADFTPYSTGGHWTLTEYGWTWVSDWDWGWAAFHYGRWLWLNNSWGWMPGRVWGPAWVSWRRAGGYVGWSPIGPRRGCIPSGRGWRFIPGAHLGTGRMGFVHAGAVPGLLSRSRGYNAWRTTSAGTRYNAGLHPTLLGPSRVVTPSSLSTIPRALPRMVAPRGMQPHVPLPRNVAPVGPMYRRPMAPAQQFRPGPATAPRTFNTNPAYNPAYRPAPTSYVRPTYQAPVYSQPTYGRPTYQQPNYVRPTYQQPNYVRPTYQQPNYARPTYQAPVYSRPTYQQPTYSRPTYSQPTYSRPTYSQPTYSRPTYSAPTYRSAPMHSAPTFRSAPSFNSSPSRSSAPAFRGRR